MLKAEIRITRWIGRWVGPRSLNALLERNISPFCWESNHGYTVVQPGVLDSNLSSWISCFLQGFLWFSSVALGGKFWIISLKVQPNIFFCRHLHWSRNLVICEVFWWRCYILHQFWSSCCFFNPLTPNDLYMSRTVPLTSKHCILYIYSRNVGTEYFKHALYSPFFLLKMQFVS